MLGSMASSLEAGRPADYLARPAASDFGRAYKSIVLDELGVQPGATVADLGCGPGADFVALARAVGPTGRVLGIDNDASAIAFAVQVASHYPQAEVGQGDVHHFNLSEASVDRIHTDRVLQHVAEPHAVVAEAARVLRP